jgi:AAA domain
LADTDPIVLWTETVFDTVQDRGAIEAFIRANNITLVIIDTLATYLLVQDETDNSAVTIRMKPYVDMAHQTGTTILFIHHERKSREGATDGTQAIRGGGAILALADVSFQLQKDGGTTHRKLKIVGRYQEITPALHLDYRDEEYVCLGTPEEAWRTLQRERAYAVLARAAPGLTVDEVVDKSGMKKGAARAALEDAYGKTVDRTGIGRRGDPYRYHRLSTPVQEDGAPAAAEKELAEV